MHEGAIETVTTRAALLDRTAAAIDDAATLVSLAAPSTVVDRLEPALAAARDRGALVVLLTDGPGDVEYAAVADVVRTWPALTRAPLLCSVDRERGTVATHGLVAADEGYGLAFADYLVEWAVYGCFIGTNWDMGTEVQTPDPDPLPATYGSIRQAVVQAVLHLRERTVLAAEVGARPTAVVDDDPVTLVGRVVNVRQALLSPATSDYPGEHSIILETPAGEKVSVGGAGAFIEEYEATEITLRVAD